MALQSESFLLRRYIEKAMVDLPAMPAIVMQVVQATERDDVTTAEIEELLNKDPAMATKVLKVVNSAYFGLPRQITNIGHAVAILGLQQIRNLALSLGVLNALSSSNARVRDIQRMFWQNSFAAGCCAGHISRKRGLNKRDAELVFVGALLHDIGRLFLLTLFNIPYQQVMRESTNRTLPMRLVEQKVLGTTHAELGAELAERWNFPVDLVKLIRNHDGEFNEETTDAEFAVHICDVFADSIAEPEFVGLVTPVNGRARVWAGLTDEDAAEIRTKMKESLEQSQALLGIL